MMVNDRMDFGVYFYQVVNGRQISGGIYHSVEFVWLYDVLKNLHRLEFPVIEVDKPSSIVFGITDTEHFIPLCRCVADIQPMVQGTYITPYNWTIKKD